MGRLVDSLGVEKSLLVIDGQDCIVDSIFMPMLSNYSWSICSGYAVTYFYVNKRCITLSMHRILMGIPNTHIDHINRNRLDNRLSNLRLANRSQNMHNVSALKPHGFRGVSLSNFKKRNSNWKNKYYARIRHEGKTHYLGTFDDPKEAAIAYDKKALDLFGEYAVLNFPKITVEEVR